MRSLVVGEIALISGGFSGEEYYESNPSMRFNDGGSDYLFDGGRDNGGSDQRNDSQIKDDNTLNAALKACDLLVIGSTTCKNSAKKESYQLQLGKYNACKYEGGSDGPNDCGVRPTPPRP